MIYAPQKLSSFLSVPVAVAYTNSTKFYMCFVLQIVLIFKLPIVPSSSILPAIQAPTLELRESS